MPPQTLQAVRGMNDILPADIGIWQSVEETVRSWVARYAYQEIRFPIVEKTELFKRSIGEVTDIVEKEMYTFPTSSGDSLSLRPEGTAVCVRSGVQHGLFRGGQQRLWYMGPMFRHERPQQGRYRQFHQLGVEAFGIEGPDIDAEMLIMCARLWKELGVESCLSLQLNSIGTPASRAEYRIALQDYFRQHHSVLDEDSQRRLETNPLRILDSKNPDLSSLIEAAPKLPDYLDQASRDHFQAVCTALDAVGIQYTVNPRLVRGLDYYSLTVFEWVTDRLGAQDAVCSGGRYDGLVKQLGGRPTPAIGFAMGLERLIALVKDVSKLSLQQAPFIYAVYMGEQAFFTTLKLSETLRDKIPGLALQMNVAGGSFKSQMKRADKSGAAYALIIGESEIENGVVQLKPLRHDAEQQTIERTKLADVVRKLVSEND